jgi:DUF4097 and DUF4098 domain-containing protein YvlB
MKVTTMKNTNAFSIMFLLVGWLASPQAATTTYAARQDEPEERFSRQFDIGAEGAFSLSNISGDIFIRSGSGNQVEVEAVKRVHGARSDADTRRQLESVEIEVTHSENRLRVNTRYTDRDERGGRDINVSVDYRVTVPSGTEVTAKSVSGNVDVQGVRGELEVESVSGEVTVTDAAQLILAKSVSGNVEVASAGSETLALEISSVSGDVDSRSVRARELRLNSVSGDVDVSDASCERVELNTVSGDVRYTGSLAPSGRYEFKSHSGDVRITIPGDVGFELEAQSFSGEIESDFALTVHSLRRQRNVSGTFGDGSAVINATTFSGDINIQKR